MRLINAETGAVVVEHLELADTWWTRFKGLQFRREFLPGHGLLFIPCGSIHTCWLRWPITVVALDKHGEVLEIREDIRPWRVVFLPRGTHATLELPNGRFNTNIGAHLALDACRGATLQ